MPQTPRMGYLYGAEEQDPWYDIHVAFMNQLDNDQYASFEDPSLILRGGGNISLDAVANELTWTAKFELMSMLTGGIMTIQPATLTGFEDGKVAYVEISRPLIGVKTGTLAVADNIGGNRNYVFIALRRGSVVYFRNHVNRTAFHMYDFLGMSKITTALALAGGGTVDGSINLGVDSGSNWRLSVKALMDTVNTSIEFFSDVGLTDRLYFAPNKDCYTSPHDDRVPWWFGTLTSGLIYYRLTNHGANNSTYELELVGFGPMVT